MSAEDVIMPHILADFVSAAELMSHGATTQGDGHATKGAAEGMLARAYMFYEGFYKKAGELATANLADVELPAQEGVTDPLSKQKVIDYLNDAINNGGYKLVEDFRLLWQYTNELTAPDYPFVKDLADAGKFWAGNGNSEEMFQVQFMNAGSWNGNIGMGFTNMASLYCGLRCDEDENKNKNGDAGEMPFGQGWGQGTINANLWDDWSNADPERRRLSLMLRLSCHHSYSPPHAQRMPVIITRSGCLSHVLVHRSMTSTSTIHGGAFIEIVSRLVLLTTTLSRETTSATLYCFVWQT